MNTLDAINVPDPLVRDDRRDESRTGRRTERPAASASPCAGPASASNAAAPPVRTVDVFDTLVLRRPSSAARRERDAARRWRSATENADDGAYDPAAVAAVRAVATRALYRAMERPDGTGDVPFDLIARLTIEALGGTPDVEEIARFRKAEIAMEIAALRPNHALLAQLRHERAGGTRVIAVSDTPHAAADLRAIIGGVVGDDVPLDAIHTSADHGLTKRGGHLFAAVAAVEGFDPSRARHIGDDAAADGTRARAAGLAATVRPRSRLHHARRRLDAFARRSTRVPLTGKDPLDLGAAVVVDGMLRLWVQLRAIELAAHRTGERMPIALFCARGGLTMHACLERFVERTGLPLGVVCSDLMVSRIVACRPALLAGSDAAFAECAREFRRERFGTALRALIGEEVDVEGFDPDAPFDAAALRRMLASPRGAPLHAALEAQSARFAAHLEGVAPGNVPVVLVDSGLFGSTMRLLADANPYREWRSVLLARANYKDGYKGGHGGSDTGHFARTIGLWSERDRYAPHDARSAVLRYWQWVEDLFEPALPSVVGFDAGGRSTIERADGCWRERVLLSPKPALARALARIDGLDPASLPALAREGDAAWRALRRVLIAPTRDEARVLAVSGRSRDFGLAGTVEAFGAPGDARPLAWLRAARWKEGAAAWRYPRARLPVQLALEGAHALRWCRARLRRPSS